MGRTIEQLIEAAQAKHNLNHRFVKEIEALIDLGVVARSGGNIWLVDGYEVNQFTKTCTCPTNYEVNLSVGKMCPHVFAMHVMRMHEQDNPKQRLGIDEILKKGISEIRIDWDYESGRRVVVGYVIGREFTRLKSDEKFEITFDRFSSTLRRNGYALVKLPQKLEGTFEYIYQWFVSKDRGGIMLTENMWNTKSVTSAMVEANRRKDAMRRLELEAGGA